ncbi:MAG: hypothetical protein M0R21_00835 [Lentimicrobiaceae bacterium]|nr:hypothetical protein [Lentimicrobiaceae bacterium]
MGIKNLLICLKPGVSHRTLVFTAALIWGFAGLKILWIGIPGLLYSSHHVALHFSIGLAGVIPFFYFVFRKVFHNHLRRINTLMADKPCIFSFFSFKSYLLMIMMIALGILVSNFHIFPTLEKNIFYISLEMSLFTSALLFFWVGLFFNK